MRLLTFLLALASLVSLSLAGAPKFCKCTCFKNSTIIPMGPENQSDSTAAAVANADADADATTNEEEGDTTMPRHSLNLFTPGHPLDLTDRTASASCSDCTKAFCLGQDLDICSGATEDDVVTMCFQRDSNKDKIIVWAFIAGTSGLLGWTLFKKVAAWRNGSATGFARRQDAGYAPVVSAER